MYSWERGANGMSSMCAAADDSRENSPILNPNLDAEIR
jgi:hypothetical protein